MSDDIPSIISHVSLGTRDMGRAVAFYDALLATVGAVRLETVDPEGAELVAAAYGKRFPEFWIQLPIDGEPAGVGNGIHVGFIAPDRASVHRFHETALSLGGVDDGAPGPRPPYGAPYYGCFIRDLDGNKIEASCWDESDTGGGNA